MLPIVTTVQATTGHIEANPGPVSIKVNVDTHIRCSPINAGALPCLLTKPVHYSIFGQLSSIAAMSDNRIGTEKIYRQSARLRQMPRPVNLLQLRVVVFFVIYSERIEWIQHSIGHSGPETYTIDLRQLKRTIDTGPSSR